MAQTVLQIAQEVCRRMALPVPTSIFSTNEDGFLQLRGLFNELMQDIMQRYRFQFAISRVTWTTVGTEVQGTVPALFGQNLDSIVSATIFNDTLRRPLFGPLDDRQYQTIKTFVPSGPINQYVIQGDNFKILPIPTAGQTISAIVRSKNWLTLASGGTGYFIANDADTPLLDDVMIYVGLKMKYKMEKNLPYAEDEQTFEEMCMARAVRDGTQPVLYASGGTSDVLPGIFVPQGNWPVV